MGGEQQPAPRVAPADGGVTPMPEGAVLGWGLAQVRPEDTPAMRKRPGPLPEGWGRVPPGLLRASDEQTVACVAAAFAAMAAMGRAPEDFEGWGVVAAPRYLGRAALAAALRSFDAEGVWGVSPHLIPHFALHSPSGTISQALGLHGPNLGVGGGRHATAEGFLAALSWVAAGTVPGSWLVLSGWDPELVPRADRGPADARCLALALALGPVGAAGDRPRVRVAAEAGARPAPAPLDLAWLGRHLDLGAPGPLAIAASPSGSWQVELLPAGDERRRGRA